MEKINSFDEVLLYLKEKAIITTDGKNMFYLKDGKVIHKFKGNSLSLKKEDFISLYSDEEFFLIEDNSVYIDDNKDEDYYRYYKK